MIAMDPARQCCFQLVRFVSEQDCRDHALMEGKFDCQHLKGQEESSFVAIRICWIDLLRKNPHHCCYTSPQGAISTYDHQQHLYNAI